MQNVRFGIVGIGHIGMRHAKVILENSHSELVAVCDSSPTKKDSLPETISFYTSLAVMLSERSDIDVLCICTPNYLHTEQALLAITSGCHVLIEKPMAITVEDCEKIIATAQKHERRVFPVMQNRFNPAIQWVKGLLCDHLLGDIFHIQMNCYWNRNKAYYQNSDWRGKIDKDGGVLFTQFSHFIDICYYLDGPITIHNGLVSNYLHVNTTEFPDTGSYILKGKSGSIINLNYTTNAFDKNMEGAITLFGSKGTVKVGGQYLNKISYCQVENYQLPEEVETAINAFQKPNNYGTYQGSMSNHDKVYQNIIDTLRDNKPFYTSAEDGIEVVKIIVSMIKNSENI